MPDTPMFTIGARVVIPDFLPGQREHGVIQALATDVCPMYLVKLDTYKDPYLFYPEEMELTK